MDPANLAKALRLQQTLKEAAQASNEIIKIAHGELEEKKFELQRCKASLASVTEEKNMLESRVLGLQQDLNKMMDVLKESNRQLGESTKARQDLQRKVSAFIL